MCAPSSFGNLAVSSELQELFGAIGASSFVPRKLAFCSLPAELQEHRVYLCVLLRPSGALHPQNYRSFLVRLVQAPLSLGSLMASCGTTGALGLFVCAPSSFGCFAPSEPQELFGVVVVCPFIPRKLAFCSLPAELQERMNSHLWQESRGVILSFCRVSSAYRGRDNRCLSRFFYVVDPEEVCSCHDCGG